MLFTWFQNISDIGSTITYSNLKEKSTWLWRSLMGFTIIHPCASFFLHFSLWLLPSQSSAVAVMRPVPPSMLPHMSSRVWIGCLRLRGSLRKRYRLDTRFCGAFASRMGLWTWQRSPLLSKGNALNGRAICGLPYERCYDISLCR